MRRTLEITLLLAVCAAMGTMAATSLTCGIGLLNGTEAWCSVGSIWILAIPISVVMAWLAGAMLLLPFFYLKIRAWWHYAAAGLLVAVPVWLSFAQPFTSIRWQQSGAYDSLNYLGSGLISSLLFWLTSSRGKSSAA